MQPPSQSPTMSLDELAGLLGLEPEQLKRRHLKMTRRAGFPARLDGAAWRWSRRAVLRWIDAAAQPAAAPATNDNIVQFTLGDLQRADLAERYGREAHVEPEGRSARLPGDEKTLAGAGR